METGAGTCTWHGKQLPQVSSAMETPTGSQESASAPGGRFPRCQAVERLHASTAAYQGAPADTVRMAALAPPPSWMLGGAPRARARNERFMQASKQCTERQFLLLREASDWGGPPSSSARSEAGTRSAGAGASAAPSSRSMPVPSAEVKCSMQLLQ